MATTKELNEYRHFMKPAEVDKAINMLRGIVAGIKSSGEVNDLELTELINWCSLHENLRDRHPFTELLPKIDAALEDGQLDAEECQDILWFCDNFTGEGDYFNLATARIQFLHGLIHGIMADGKLTDEEIRALHDWIVEQEGLKGTYPFDEIEGLLTEILADGVITDDERNMLSAFLSNFIEFKDSANLVERDYAALREQYTVAGICAVDPEIEICGRQFCFTGEAGGGTRAELVAQIEALGGVFKSGVSKKTDYLVIGSAGNPCWAFSCYGRKVEDAMNLRKNGGKVQIIKEADFWDAVLNVTGE